MYRCLQISYREKPLDVYGNVHDLIYENPGGMLVSTTPEDASKEGVYEFPVGMFPELTKLMDHYHKGWYVLATFFAFPGDVYLLKQVHSFSQTLGVMQGWRLCCCSLMDCAI